MAELTKVRRVIGKQLEGAPHETLLTVDATTGQNGLRQAKLFSEAVPVDGIVLTKLDGTAKGGIALAIAGELGIPVKLIGIGEALEDLRPFDADDFARALGRPRLTALTPDRSGTSASSLSRNGRVGHLADRRGGLRRRRDRRPQLLPVPVRDRRGGGGGGRHRRRRRSAIELVVFLVAHGRRASPSCARSRAATCNMPAADAHRHGRADRPHRRSSLERIVNDEAVGQVQARRGGVDRARLRRGRGARRRRRACT